MKLPRFKITKIGKNSQMSISEYNECCRSIEKRNAIKEKLNNILDIIDNPNNIETIFGTFNNIQIEPYSDNETYSLSKIEDDKAGTYMILGFDAPMEGDREWRFWVECGDEDGYAETHAANIKPEEEKLIKQMYFDYKEKSKSLSRIEEKQGEDYER